MPITDTEVNQLARIRTVDLTTIGRQSGLRRTVEIWWFHVDDRFIITGTPGRRDWLANVRAHPEVTIATPFGEYGGTATEIDDQTFKTRVFEDPAIGWYSSQAQLEHLVEASPMIEVRLY